MEGPFPQKRESHPMSREKKHQKVLLLCLGNICRSPTAEGVLRARAEARGVLGALTIDSAGTAAYHTGEPPDPRSIEAALARGYDLRSLRARQLADHDFQTFDEILAMDESNLHALRTHSQSTSRQKAETNLFLSYAPHRTEEEVPDPYYGGANGFETVLDLCEAAADGWLDAHGWTSKG
jgi:protein-tyrosine phosphatase